MNISRFLTPEYLNISDQEFVWEIIKDSNELNEDREGSKNREKLRTYELENNTDLYKDFPNVS